MLSYRSAAWQFYKEVQISSGEHTWFKETSGREHTSCHTCSSATSSSFFFYKCLSINKMFWGLTLEVGKQYTQIVEEGFHITMATLDPLTIKDKEGDGEIRHVYILRLRHNKQDYILCTLEPGKQYSQRLDLNFSEGEEVSFFLEGSDEGTLHLTGYLVELQSMTPEEVMLDSDYEEMSSEEEEEEEEEEESSEEEEVPNGLSLHALTAGDELEEESEEEWAPNAGKSKKRKRVGVTEKGKKKRKKSASSTSTSTSTTSTGGEEEEEEEEELSDELDDEEDSEDFDSEDDEEDDEDESEEEEEEDSSEEVVAENSMDHVRGVLDFEENEMSDSEMSDSEDSEEEESETTHSEPSTPGDTPEVKGKKSQQQVKSNKKGQGQKATVKQEKDVETPAGKKKKSQQQQKTAEKAALQIKKEKETPQEKVVNGEAQTQTASQKKKNKRKSGKEFQDGATTQPASEQAEGANSNKKKAGTPGKQVLPGGLVVIDRELGTGKVAKAGRRVGLYYKGTLAQNNKHFDSRLNGKPFTFTLGHGEVIKGWDIGVQGMKIGGKRRLEIPPAMAYGSQRLGPIPANSKLIFEVELKSVS